MSLSDLLERVRFLSSDRRVVRLPGWLGWGGLAGLILSAALMRFQLPPVALSEWDSWGWLHPALSWMGGLGFREEYEREWLYGAFIAFCLRLTGSFAGYIQIQQLLGLAAGLLMWLTWRTWLSLFPRNLALEIFATVVGLYLIALYLFSPIAMAFELAIRPEAIMAFTAFLQLFCVVSYCKFRWKEPQAAACLIFGALSLPLAWAMFVLKPNWALAVPATVLPVFLGMFGQTLPRTARLLPPALGGLLIVLTLWLPDKLLFIRTEQTRMVLPMTLFTIHADIIRENLANELQWPETTTDRRQFLESFLPVLDREMQTAKVENPTYKRIGFDPDYLMYRSSIFPFLRDEWGMTAEQTAAFCRRSFLSAILSRPLDYARKVGSQMGYFFFPDDGTFFRKRVELAEAYTHSLQTLPATLEDATNAGTQALFQTYRRQSEEQAGRAENLEAVRSFREFLKSAKSFTLTIEIAFLLSLAACFLWKPLGFLRLPGLVALLIFSAPLGNALTVSMVHALDNSRYRGSYGPLLLFSLGVFLVYIVAVTASTAVSLWRRRRLETA